MTFWWCRHNDIWLLNMSGDTFLTHIWVCSVTPLCPSLCNPMGGLQPARLLCSRDFPGKKTGVGCRFLLQGLFLDEEPNPQLLHWQADSLPLSHPINIFLEEEPVPVTQGSIVSWLQLPCLCIPSLFWLARVWTCSLEHRGGPRGYIKSISYKKEMGEHRKDLYPETAQGLAKFQYGIICRYIFLVLL